MSILNTSTFRGDDTKKKHGTADISTEKAASWPCRGMTNDADRKKAKEKKK